MLFRLTFYVTQKKLKTFQDLLYNPSGEIVQMWCCPKSMYNFRTETAVIFELLRSDHKYSNDIKLLWIIWTDWGESELPSAVLNPGNKKNPSSCDEVLRKFFIKSLNSVVNHSVTTQSTVSDLRWQTLLTTISAHTDTNSHLSPSVNGVDSKK